MSEEKNEELAAAAAEAAAAAQDDDVEGHAADVDEAASFTNVNFGCSSSAV